MVSTNHVASKYQLRSMSAMVYKMTDGAEVLQSYNTIVALRLADGQFAFSSVWTSKDGSMTTKRHIGTWSGKSIKAIRDGIKKHCYKTFEDVNKDYLRAIKMATYGRIG